MFHSSRPNLIESDEGFSIEVLGRTGLLYKEGDHSMSIESEGGRGGITVWKSTIGRWQPPHHDEPVDESKREAILDNIRRAVRFAGDDIEVIG